MNSSFINSSKTASIACYEPSDVYEILQQICKVVSVVFYWLFLFLIFAIKQHRNKNLAFLINMDLIGVYTLTFYSFFSFSTSCEASSQSLCEYQSLFVYYSIYMSAYNVVALSVYRLMCTITENINKHFTPKRIVLIILFIWIFPLFAIVLPAYVLRIRVYYDIPAAACRMDLTNQMGFFIAYLIIGNILPSLLVFGINLKIFLTIRKTNIRIHTTVPVVFNMTANLQAKKQDGRTVTCVSNPKTAKNNANSVSFKDVRRMQRKAFVQYCLLLQLVVLLLVFEIYAIANVLLLVNTAHETAIFTSNDLKVIRVFRWIYHVINPVIYLFLNPIVYESTKIYLKALCEKFKCCR